MFGGEADYKALLDHDVLFGQEVPVVIGQGAGGGEYQDGKLTVKTGTEYSKAATRVGTTSFGLKLQDKKCYMGL